MFNIGTEYRVSSLKEGFGLREGTLVDCEGPVFTLDIEGVHTTFHMAAVAYVERIDREAESARTDAWISSFGDD